MITIQEQSFIKALNYTGFMDTCEFDTKNKTNCSDYYDDYGFAFTREIDPQNHLLVQNEYLLPPENNHKYSQEQPSIDDLKQKTGEIKKIEKIVKKLNKKTEKIEQKNGKKQSNKKWKKLD